MNTMQARKFWIVEYVDVNAPKAERSEICSSRNDAIRKVIARAGFIHFSYMEDFVGEGLCDFLQNRGSFYTEEKRV